jgi:hypothetical protein
VAFLQLELQQGRAVEQGSPTFAAQVTQLQPAPLHALRWSALTQ